MSENVYQIDFNKPESVHFIGIGGISMSGLAEILMDEGFTVSGSDAHRSELTDNLEARIYRTESGEYPGWHQCGCLYRSDSPG